VPIGGEEDILYLSLILYVLLATGLMLAWTWAHRES
jgi:hypothetical protein